MILIAGIGITVFPFLWMLFTSFKTKGESMAIPPTIFPQQFATEAYNNVLTALPFGRIYMKKARESYLRPFRVQGLRNASYRERTTQKAHADMYNTRSLSLFFKARHGCI